MKVRICDICKNPMNIPTHKVKIKREWRLFHESIWIKYDLCDDCADRIIEKLEGHDRELANQTGWIPVSERLPKEPGNYLVTLKYKHNSFVEQIWYDGEDNHAINWRCSNIRAWMPLPEPYKIEGSDCE